MIDEASATPTLSVAIVTHHSDPGRLEATLDSLFNALLRAHGAGLLDTASVVLCDNASGDGYARQLQTLLAAFAPRCTEVVSLQLRRAPRNDGYGSGCNRALAGSTASHALILNPDVDLAADAIAAGLRALGLHPQAVAASPCSENARGEREYLCKRYPALFDLLLRGIGSAALARCFAGRLARYEYRELGDGEASPVQLLSGACMLIDRRALAAVGGFDTRFFMYFEDYDLSLRLGAHGTLLYVPSMRIVHHGGGAARKGARHIRWFGVSAWRFYRRHGWRWL
jgi:GT2 family glycosyltransferase